MVKPLEKAGCLELRTAGFIIGWLGMIGSVLLFCIAAVYVAAENGEEARSHDQADVAFSVIRGILLGAYLLGAAISGLLIYGIKQNRHSMLLPWLVLGIFSLVLSYFKLFVAATFSRNFQVILFELFSTGLNSYFYYVIYSLYTHMKMDSGKGRVLTPAPAAAVLLQPAYCNYDKV